MIFATNISVPSASLLRPIPFWVKSYSLSDLFAGKICALLCRQWKLRVKGRDWYDFLWFIQGNIAVNLSHLEKRLRGYTYYQEAKPLTPEILSVILQDKIKEVDLKLAKEDIIKFIKNPSSLEAWSDDLFISAVKQMSYA